MIRIAAALVLAAALGLLPSAPAGAQSPSLFVAADGPVTVQSLTAISGTEIWYSTGAGLADRELAGQVMPGGSATTTALNAGTNVILATPILNYFIGCSGCGPVQLMTGRLNPENGLYAGAGELGNPYEASRELAAVSFQPGNTALVGFPNQEGQSTSGPISGFPLQFLVSNVRGTIGTVPEPEMWAFTLLGLLGAGLLRRRKR